MKAFTRAFHLLPVRQRIGIWLFFFARVLAQALDVAGVAYLGFAAAYLTGQGFRLGPIENLIPGELQGFNTSPIILLLPGLGLFVAKSLVSLIVLWTFSKFLARIEAKFSDRLVSHFRSGSLDSLRFGKVGDIQWLITHSVHHAFSSVPFSFVSLATEASLFALMIGMFLLVDAALTIALLLYFALFLLSFQMVVGPSYKRSGRKIASSERKLNSTLLDTIGVFREAAVGGKIKEFVEALSSTRREFAIAKSFERFALSIPRYLLEIALILGLLLFVVWQLDDSSETVSVAKITIFIAASARMVASILPLQNAVNQLRVNAPQAEPALELFEGRSNEFKDENLDLGSTRLRAGGVQAPSIEVRNLTFQFEDSSTPTLKDVNLSIPPGSKIAIIGPSGSGKSTLMNILLGLISPTNGEVSVGGLSPRGFREQREGIAGYVPQKPGVIEGTVEQNIALTYRSDGINQSKMNQAIEASGFQGVLPLLPKGLKTLLGHGSAQLSGGQLQRLGLARALYLEPHFLALDEVTSGLDAVTEHKLVQSLKRLDYMPTSVIIAHRLVTVKDADWVFVLESGRVVAEGTFSQVRKSVPMIAEYIRLSEIPEN